MLKDRQGKTGPTGERMTAKAAPTKLKLDPPGQGSWKQDPVHFPRPLTRYFQEMHPPAFKAGTNDFARFYGLLIDGIEVRYVQGFAYNQILPVPDAEHPARHKRAAEALEKKLWREQLKEWDEKSKPAALATHRELQSVDPDKLSDADLAAYLRRCRDHHAAMITQHMRYTAGAVLPVGDFLAHVGIWTGLPAAELLGLMRGASQVSAGGSDEMGRLKSAFAANPAARALLDGEGDAGKTLASLRALPGEAGAAVNAYLDLIGNRLIDGFDIAEPTALELPDALLKAIRIAVSGEGENVADLDAAIASVRARVPAAHEAAFDALLQEARNNYRLRDERGVYSDIWASGIMRRAALSAGRRLAANGRIADPKHMLEADIDEMCALVAGKDGPSAKELASRAQYRAAHTAKDVPPFLGPPPQQPDPTMLPAPVARIMRAVSIALGHLFESSDAKHDDDTLFGLAASKGVYEGPARRVAGPSEFGRIAKGDVLITESTTEAFNILLPLLGGIVTDNGGLLSHAAIVAREYGIPGVVGTREATDRIKDGMRVRVDGDAGEVTVLA